MFVSPTLSVALADTLMLLPVHVPFAGDVIVAVGFTVSPPPDGGSVTVTLTLAVAVRFAASVTVRFSVCVPRGTALVSQLYEAVEPVTLWSESVIALSCLSTKRVGEPCAFAAPMLTVTAPLTLWPFVGLKIDAVSVPGGGGGGVPPPLHDGAPDGFTGL